MASAVEMRLENPWKCHFRDSKFQNVPRCLGPQQLVPSVRVPKPPTIHYQPEKRFDSPGHGGEGGGGLGVGGGKRRGLGPRNDVLTTCKAIILRDGQQIIAAFSHSKYF